MNDKLYDLLDLVRRSAIQVSGTAADAAYGVGKLAEEALSAARLRVRLATLEGQVEDRMVEVGEMMYATHTGKPTESDVLLEKLQEIDGLRAEIASISEALGRQQAGPACPACGAAVQEGDAFCRTCGGKL